jgi:hypothetical protein
VVVFDETGPWLCCQGYVFQYFSRINNQKNEVSRLNFSKKSLVGKRLTAGTFPSQNIRKGVAINQNGRRCCDASFSQ